LIPAAISTASWLLTAATATTVATGTYVYTRSRNEEETNRAYASGRNDARAEYDLRLEQFQEQILELREKDSRYYHALVAVMRAAYSTAHAQGALNHRTRRDIDELLMGELRRYLPAHVRQKIDQAFHQPLPLAEARRKAAQYVDASFLAQLGATVEELAY